MWTTVECAGHPRDMGMAQGAAARAAIRAEIARAGLPLTRSRIPTLRPLASGPLRGGGAGREFFRHFAHQSERLEGLAYAAGVPTDSVLDLHLRVRAGGAEGGLLSRRASVRARTVGGSGEDKRALLERSLPSASDGEMGWIVRESRPALAIAALLASKARLLDVSPSSAICRWRIPVRERIHSSEVSMRCARSSLVTTLRGR